MLAAITDVIDNLIMILNAKLKNNEREEQSADNLGWSWRHLHIWSNQAKRAKTNDSYENINGR